MRLVRQASTLWRPSRNVTHFNLDVLEEGLAVGDLAPSRITHPLPRTYPEKVEISGDVGFVLGRLVPHTREVRVSPRGEGLRTPCSSAPRVEYLGGGKDREGNAVWVRGSHQAA